MHFETDAVSNQVADNTKLCFSQNFFDSTSDILRIDRSFYGIDAGKQTSFCCVYQVLDRTLWRLTDHYRERAICLHALIRDHQVKAHDIAAFKRHLSRDTMHNLVINTDANITWKLHLTRAICRFGTILLDLCADEIINFDSRHADANKLFNISKYLRQDSAAFAHCLYLFRGLRRLSHYCSTTCMTSS